MRNEGTNTQETDNELDRPSSMSDTDAQRTPTIMGKLKNWAGAQYLAVALLATPALTGCEPKAAPTPVVIDNSPTPANLEKWHLEAEAEATRLGWSQGVKSLAAGVIDYYYYYKESANGPLLIRLSYQVDVDDFIKKIEADAANRKTYDPKTEGVFQASVVSLEGDSKQNTWFVPSSAIYDAKSQGKDKLALEIGKYPSPNAGRNTIETNEGIRPTKQMQIYSDYGIRNAKKVEDRNIDSEKRGALKDIL